MGNKYITKGGYLQFDATTIEQYIKDVLNNPNNGSKFTDQNFEGSYFSSIIEVISYTFNVLMFYLNQTSTESTFTDAQLFENMNRIVKMMGYNPVGYQSSLLAYSASATGLEANSTYYIPRYSYINAGGTTYSFNKDLIFRGNNISEAVNDSILYQGKFYEYPLYTAEGGGNELIYLTPGNNVIVDHFNIHVYVKSESGVWREWDRIESLTLANASDEAFEVRFNENEVYELTFGNNINGKELVIGDSVAIYYLQSDGANNEVDVGALAGVKYVRFASAQFTTIFADITESLNIGTLVPANAIVLNNAVPSTPFSTPETVEEIRQNAPYVLKEKNTLSNPNDFERHIIRNYSNVIQDASVVDNWEYTGSFLKYFYNLGIQNSQSVSRILFNQVNYADSCNFNNIYMFIKPKIASDQDYKAFLSPPLKQMILNSVDSLKISTCEPIICDPVYMAIDIGINDLTTDPNRNDADKSKLVIIKSSKSFRSDDSIINDVNNIFLDYFSQENTKFGMTISFPELNDRILSVDGIVDIKVVRTDSDVYYSGLSLITWNPVYEVDSSLLLRSTTYEFFQVPYWHNRGLFINKIEIEMES